MSLLTDTLGGRFMKLLIGLVVLLMVGLNSCDLARTSGPAFSEDGFSVYARSGTLLLRNDSPAAIHYVALEEETSALVDLYFDPQQ